MNIQPIFPCFLGTEQIKDLVDLKAIEDFCYTEERLDTKQKWLGGWQSTRPFLNDPIMLPLINIIKDRLIGISRMYGLSDQAHPTLKNGWININNPGNYSLHNNPPHIHANYFFSVVFYVKAEPKSGDLVLIAPSNTIEHTVPFSAIDHRTVYNSPRWHIAPEPGNLVMFPSWVMHYVEGNVTQNDRISIAFNTVLPTIEHPDY